MRRSLIALATITLLAGPAFAECEAYTSYRTIDNLDTERCGTAFDDFNPRENAADICDPNARIWLSSTESLSPTTGGDEAFIDYRRVAAGEGDPTIDTVFCP